jgi:hypothetical protein
MLNNQGKITPLSHYSNGFVGLAKNSCRFYPNRGKTVATDALRPDDAKKGILPSKRQNPRKMLVFIRF